MALPDVPGGTSRSQQIAYYESYLTSLPGTYSGSLSRYDGLTWAALYQTIANGNPSADPRELAGAIVILEAAQRLNRNLGAATDEFSKFLTTSEKAVANTNFAAGVPGSGALTGLAAIGQFFSNLGNRNLWLRAAKVIAGVALVIIGVAHLVHAGSIISTAAAKAVPL